jgi:hypothetical protein
VSKGDDGGADGISRMSLDRISPEISLKIQITRDCVGQPTYRRTAENAYNLT